MVVECGKCGTRFQLEEARIPEKGVRVRCSRCKHAFHLMHPNADRDRAIHDVAGEAVEQERSVAPGTTQDLPMREQAAAPPGYDEDDDDGYGPEEDYDDEGDYEDEEDDWEFNQELPSGEDGEDEDPEIDFGDISSEDLDGVDDESLDVADAPPTESSRAAVADDPADAGIPSDAGPMLESEGASHASEPPASAIDIGSEGYGGDALEEQVASVKPSSCPAPGFGGEREDAFGSVDDFSSLMESEDQPEAGIDDSELEDPESWDFFAGGGQAAAPSTAPIARLNLATRDPRTGEVNYPESTSTPSRTADELSSGLMGSRAGTALQGLVSGLGWVLTLGLLAVGLGQGFVLALDSELEPAAFVPLGELQAREISGHWLETARLGTLYVVTGELANPTRAAVAPMRMARVVLEDSLGRPLAQASASLGRGLPPDALREMSAEELERALALAERELVYGSIRPGEAVPVVAVFEELPGAAARFTLQALDAQVPAPAPTGELEAARDEAGDAGSEATSPTSPRRSSPSPE